jgi:hypothetical protein
MTRINKTELIKAQQKEQVDAWDMLKFELSSPFNWFVVGLLLGRLIG